MNTTELIEAVRMGVFIAGSTFPDYDDPRLIVELNNTMHSTFERMVAAARAGYWQKYHTLTTTPGRAKYRIPYRAVTGGLENVCVSSDGLGFAKLEEVSETHSLGYETLGAGVLKYCVRGDQVVLLPAPQSALTLRMTYYIRPSRLVPDQPGGVITAVDPVARIITVNTVPDSYLNPIAPAPLTDADRIDVVHPGGWHELSLVAAPHTRIDEVITVGGTDPLDEVEVGDYVRVAEQTDEPCLPDDFHRLLADLTAAKVMTQLNMLQKSQATIANAASDLQRLTDMLVPRVKAEAKAVKAPMSVLVAGRSMRGFYGWR